MEFSAKLEGVPSSANFEIAVLRFALFALLKAEKNVLYVDQGDKKVVLSPSHQLIRSDKQQNDQESK